MRHPIALVIALVITFAGCGAGPGTGQNQGSSPGGAVTEDDANTAGAVSGGMMGGLSSEVRVEPEIAGAWSGVRLKVVDSTTGDVHMIDAQLGETVALGDSSLTLTADLFLPDFLMDEDGIRSRSPETHNPAARVVISEVGAADYRGWLFAAMPEIHPFPHHQYQVLLVEGIPSP